MLILENELLARHGYWRVGGPLERLVLVENLADLRALPRVDHVLGNGSNLLVPDVGLRGVTVRLGGALREVEIIKEDGNEVTIRVGGGLLNSGGAVAMNAGTALGEIAERLVAVEGIDGTRLRRDQLDMSYREGNLPQGFVVVAAELRVGRSQRAAEREQVRNHLARRRATQPLDLPSCGSVFRNPPGDHAGRLIEAAGLKGWRCGAAEISERHGNFIVNRGGATAHDVMTCIHAAWSEVRLRTSIALVPEVHVLGDWPAALWPLSG